MDILRQVQHASPGDMLNGVGSISHPTMRTQGKTGNIAITQNTSVGFGKHTAVTLSSF